jgi:hypothetical protein
MIQIKNKLKKFVNLNNIKVTPTRNKKIISTCLYIPSNLSYNERSIYYFQGLVKSVETFDAVMNLDSNNRWIYRIYYDKMFDSGINFMFNKNHKKTKQMTTKQKRVELKRRKLLLTKKKKQSTNEYKYAYNGGIYQGATLDVREALVKYKDSFKKLLKLYHLYLKQIKNNKDNRYQNIELISYDCPAIKTEPEFIGHSSSFGMFLRFTPILDPDVDLFYSVNSTHPVTPQLRVMLDKWASNTDETAFCFAYQTQNVIGSSKKYIVESVEAIKGKEELVKKEIEFVEIIDRIFNILQSELTYDFDYIKKKRSKSSKSGRSSKTSKLLDSDYNFKNLLYNEAKFSLDMAIGGGMCGFKKDFPILLKRYDVFIDYINYLISHKIQLDYGLDELILKIILLPEIYINSDTIDNIDYINIRELNQYAECSSSIFQLKQHPSTQTYVFDEHGTKIYFNRNALFNPQFDLFGDNWLIQIDAVDSRALYKKEDGTEVSSDEILTLKIDEDDLSFNSLFVSYNEPTKLLLLDTNNKSHSLIKPNEIFELDYINNYDTNNIYKLLTKLVVYYRENIVQPNTF